MRRFLAVLHARNLEFIRDRSSLGWNIVLPVLLVIGMAVMFSGGEKPLFKVAVAGSSAGPPPPFLQIRYIQFFPVTDVAGASRKVSRHQIDMLLELGPAPRYRINPDSAKGYLLERLLLGTPGPRFTRSLITGKRIRYIDWLVPGILGMNMMFSCLFGVGYVVVRYRKNGFLKRLNATPLRAIEFITAQIGSRLLLTMSITVAVYAGARYFLDIRMEGGYGALFLVALLGAVSLIALGFVIAARVSSEELAGGLLNLISWPMILASGVWFSMEGTPPLLQHVAQLFPLTQVLEAARAVMLDGAGLGDIFGHLAALAVMTTVFLVTGSVLFRWQGD